MRGSAPRPAYDFVFTPDPGRHYRVLLYRGQYRLYRLDGQRWLFDRVVPPGVADRWHAHAMPEKAARGYLALPLLSEA